MLGHVFFLGEKNCAHWLVMLIFKLVDVPKPRMAIMGKDLELSPGYCTSISVVSHEVVMLLELADCLQCVDIVLSCIKTCL